MDDVIAGIRAQSVDVDLCIVHQDNDRVYEGAENIHIQTNRGCSSRWNILPFIENEFTVFLDDDLKLTDAKIFETMLKHVETYKHVSAVGVIIGTQPENPYSSGHKVYAPIVPSEVDICMGNLNMFHTITARDLWCTQLEFIRQFRRPGTIIIGDDDIISSHLFTKAEITNFAVGNGEVPYETLSTLHGLENDPSHYTFRNELCTRLTFASTRT